MRRMDRALRVVVAGGLLVTATSVAAQAQQLAGEALRDLVAGKRVYLQTPFGGEFPLHYKVDGSVTGDGTELGLARFFAPRETGSWWVDGGNLCQQFPTWYDGRTSCFTIEKTGSDTINWTRDDGQSGQARVEG